MERYVQNHAGDALYGKYYVVFNFALLFAFLLDFGINNFVSTEISKNNNNAVIRPLLKIRFVLIGIYILLIWIFGLAIHLSPVILFVVTLSQIFAGMTLFFRAVLQGHHKFKQDAVVSVLDRFIAIVGFLFGVFVLKLQNENLILLFVWVQLIGYSVSMLFSAWLSYKTTQKQAQPLQNNNTITFASVYKKTFLFAALALLMSLFTRFDVILLKNLLKDGDFFAGIYAKGFRLLDAGLIFSGMLSIQLMPVFSKAHNNLPDLKKILWLATRIILVVSFSAAIVSFFYKDELLILLNKNIGSYQTQLVFVLLMCAYIPMASVHVFGTLLTALHDLKFLIISALICVAINILLDLLLIPNLEAIGAAISCLATQSAFALLCLIRTGFKVKINFNIKSVLSILIFTILLISGVYAMHKTNLGSVGILLCAAVVLFSVFISGLFGKEIRQVVVKKL